MKRVLTIIATGWMLAALTTIDAGSARAAPRAIVVAPPRVVVRSAGVQNQQRLSFWGVKSNLQQSGDDLQYTAQPGHHRHLRQPKKSASQKY